MKNHIDNLLFMYKQIYSISKARILLIIVQSLISTLNMVVDIFFLKSIIDGLLSRYPYTYFIVIIAIKLGALLLSQCCDNIFYNYIFKRADIRIQKELALRLFNSVKLVKLNRVEDPSYYDDYQKAISEVSNRSGALLDYLAYILSTLLKIVSLVTIIVVTDPILIIISIVGMLVTVWANIVNTKNVYKANMSFVETDRKIDYIRRVFYQPQYVKDIRRTRLPETLSNAYEKAVVKKRALVKKFWPRIIIVAISGSWLYNAVNVGLSYGYLVVRVMQKAISIGNITSLTYSINQLSNSLLQISNIIPQAIQHSLYIQNYRHMLDTLNEEDKYQSRGRNLCDFGDINLYNVSFKYPSTDKMAIKDINLSIKKGEHIAIIGENGSGKTTLVKILSALYEPLSGDISIDGNSYKDISFDSLSKMISIVDQDFQHYAFSISENIALQSKNKKIDNEMVINSLKKVNMYETISQFDKGIDSTYSKEFDSNGVEFSGGQLQRLAIARAIYADSSILIMDEPSSALDPINEQKMFNTIYDISTGKTLIIVSHRLSCVKDVDRIIVMDKGQIIETGNHEDLMRTNGKYAEMYKVQGQRYGMESADNV